MNTPPKRRTVGYLLVDLLLEITPNAGPHMRSLLEKELLPKLPTKPAAHEELSPEEYERRLQQMRPELPYLLQLLLSREPTGYPADWPDPKELLERSWKPQP